MTATAGCCLAASSYTLGCVLLYMTQRFVPGLLFLGISPFLAAPGKWLKPVRMSSPPWNIQGALFGVHVICWLVILSVLVFSVPAETLEGLPGQPYFIGPVWLLGMSGLCGRYMKTKEESQPADSR